MPRSLQAVEHQIEIVDQRFLRLALGLPERRLHEAIAGQACDGLSAWRRDSSRISCCPAAVVERVFAQPVLVDGPFDPGQAERAGAGKFLAPFVPRERLDLAVDHGRQPSLHEADALRSVVTACRLR